MAEFHSISLQEAIDSLPKQPGIVVGPDVTCLGGSIRDVFTRAFAAVDGMQSKVEISDTTYRTALDVLNEELPEKVAGITARIREGIVKLQPPLDLNHLVKAGWSSCISLTEDLLFEGALRNYLDGRPTSLSATVIDSPDISPPERTIPVYKLLGNVNAQDEDARLAVSESDMLLRQQTWPQLLRTFPDYLRDAPLLFAGTSSVIPMVRLLLSTLLGMPRPNVGKLLFLRDDPTLKDPTIRKLVVDVHVKVTHDFHRILTHPFYA